MTIITTRTTTIDHYNYDYDYYSYYYLDKDMSMQSAPLLSLRAIPIILRDSEWCCRTSTQQLALDRTHSTLEPCIVLSPVDCVST
jgi:hypothetical protein